MSANRRSGSKTRITGSSLIRWAGLAAVAAGIIFAGIQPVHPADVLDSVTSSAWAIIQPLKLSMCLLFLLGILGCYARQAEGSGWLGLAGFLLFSLSWALQSAFVFTGAFILPVLASAAPAFVSSFLGMVDGSSGEMSIGALPLLYALAGVLYVLGGLLFGVATFRAAVLPRWAGALLAVGAVLPLMLSSLVPHPFDRMFAVPVGIAVAWLGLALWTERREQARESSAAIEGSQLGSLGAK